MPHSHYKAVSIAAGKHQPALSKEQKSFNSLIKQIQTRRAKLAAWESAVPPFQQKYASELQPLIETNLDLRTKMVFGLDKAYNSKGLGKRELQKIADLIKEGAMEVLGQREDEDLKAVYARYSQSDFDEEAAAALAGMKSMLEDVFGVELGDDVDLRNPEEVMKHAAAHFDAERLAWEEAQAKRKKTPKQLAKEAKAEEEEKQISQSIREVYRKLASALHPDRETDPQERIRKTTLMQRANEAYEKNNLLKLLELQLELEHIDQAAINTLSPERLKRYNKILKGQVGELDLEIEMLENQFCARFGLSPFETLSPNSLMQILVNDIAHYQGGIQEIQGALAALEDLKQLKAWLKTLTRRPWAEDFDDLIF